MKKYRIQKITYNDGEVMFRAQKRVWPFWSNLLVNLDGVNYYAQSLSKDKAIQYIEDDIENDRREKEMRRRARVKSIEIIDQKCQKCKL